LSCEAQKRQNPAREALESLAVVNQALFALLVFTVRAASAEAPIVTFISPCECQGFHGKNRWIAKTDLSPVPLDKSAIQSVTPSQIYVWEGLGPDVDLTGMTEARMPSEEKWYALTGRVVDAKVEADGDIHIALKMPTATAWELLAPRFQLAQSGVRFGKLCLAGRHRSFRSTSKPPIRSKFASHASSR
jgi:hypothetical protein